MIRVALPFHLRTIARVEGEVVVCVEGPVTQRSVLDALEARYPALRGTIRDHYTQRRRPFLRFFACQQDLSLESPDECLPAPVATGEEPFLVVGGIAVGDLDLFDEPSRTRWHPGLVVVMRPPLRLAEIGGRDESRAALVLGRAEG